MSVRKGNHKVSRGPGQRSHSVDDTNEQASVSWQLVLSEHQPRLRWWLVGATVWAQDERNPRKQVIVAPNVADLIQQQEIGPRAWRQMS